MLKINAKKFLDILKPVKTLLPNDTVCALKQVGNFLVFNIIEPQFYFTAKVDIFEGELKGTFVVKTDNLFKILRLFNDVKIKSSGKSLVFSQNRRKYSLNTEESDVEFFSCNVPKGKRTQLENKKIAIALHHIYLEEKEGNYEPDKYVWIKDGFIYASYKPVVIHSVVKIPTSTNSDVFSDKFLLVYGAYAKLISQITENFEVFETFEEDKNGNKQLLYNFVNNTYYLKVSGVRQFEDSRFLNEINNFTKHYEDSKQIIAFEPFSVKGGVANIISYLKDTSEYGLNIRKDGDKLWVMSPSKSDGYGHEEYVINDYGKINEIVMNVDSSTFAKVLNCCGDDIAEWKILVKEDEGGKYGFNFVKTENILQGFGSEIIE